MKTNQASEVKSLKAQRDEAQELMERFRSMLEVQQEMIEHYVEERDIARRELCEFAVGWKRAGMRVQHPHQYAQERGWHCFKEKS
jgi:hypothetical protein